MRAHILLVLSVLCVSAFLAVTVQAQPDPPDAPSAKSAQTQGHDHGVEGTVVSTTRHTLVVVSDDNKYHLFTHDASTIPKGVKAGARVRVSGGALNDYGTQVATTDTYPLPPRDAAKSGAGAQAGAPPP